MLLVRLAEFDGQTDGRDFLGFFVGDFRRELVFQCHDQFDHIERISAQIFDERFLVGQLGFSNAQLFSDDLFDARFDVIHADLQWEKSREL